MTCSAQLTKSDPDKSFHAAHILRRVKVNLDVDFVTLRLLGNFIGRSEGGKLVKKVREVHSGKPFQL